MAASKCHEFYSIVIAYLWDVSSFYGAYVCCVRVLFSLLDYECLNNRKSKLTVAQRVS